MANLVVLLFFLIIYLKNITKSFVGLKYLYKFAVAIPYAVIFLKCYIDIANQKFYKHKTKNRYDKKN